MLSSKIFKGLEVGPEGERGKEREGEGGERERSEREELEGERKRGIKMCQLSVKGFYSHIRMQIGSSPDQRPVS